MARFLVPINMRFTGATVADSTVWAIRAGATPLNIRRIVLFAAFDGTAAASTARLELRRFRTATPTGGTAITPVPLDLAGAATTIAAALQDTTGAALTVTSVVFDTPMMTGATCPRGATGSVAVCNTTWEAAGIVIAPNDGLCIRNSATAVIGDVLTGFVEVEE